MAHVDNIKRITMCQTEGYGSTFISIEFEDGSTLHENPDLPYDGGCVWERQENGALKRRDIETLEEWALIE